MGMEIDLMNNINSISLQKNNYNNSKDNSKDYINNKDDDGKNKDDKNKDTSIDSKQTNSTSKTNDLSSGLKTNGLKENQLGKKSFNSVLSDVKLKSKSTKVDKKETKLTNRKISKEEIECELKELEEKMEKLTAEQIMQALNSILSMIREMSNSNAEVSSNITNNTNSIMSTNMMNALQSAVNSTQEKSENLLANIIEMLKSNDLDEFINKNNLGIAEKLLEQLKVKVQEESSKNSDFVKELINELKVKVAKLQSEKADLDGGNAKNETFTNVLSKVSEEKNFSSNAQSNNSNSGESNTRGSKEEKILNSILKDNNQTNFSSFTNSINRLNNSNVTSVNDVQSVDADNLAKDIIKNVKYMAKVNMKEMVVKVNPANLGEITIKLVEENGEMKLNIKSSSKETYTLLSQQLGDINDQLKDQNIKIQDVKLSLYEDDTTFFKGEQFNHESSNNEGSRQQSNHKAQNLIVNENEDLDIDSAEAEDLSNINMLA